MDLTHAYTHKQKNLGSRKHKKTSVWPISRKPAFYFQEAYLSHQEALTRDALVERHQGKGDCQPPSWDLRHPTVIICQAHNAHKHNGWLLCTVRFQHDLFPSHNYTNSSSGKTLIESSRWYVGYFPEFLEFPVAILRRLCCTGCCSQYLPLLEVEVAMTPILANSSVFWGYFAIPSNKSICTRLCGCF